MPKLNGFSPIWNVSPLAEKFLRLCATHMAEYEKARIQCIRETRALFEKLSALPQLKVFGTYSNFILFRILNERVTSIELRDHLLSGMGFYVRDCSRKAGLGEKLYSRRHKFAAGERAFGFGDW